MNSTWYVVENKNVMYDGEEETAKDLAAELKMKNPDSVVVAVSETEVDSYLKKIRKG